MHNVHGNQRTSGLLFDALFPQTYRDKPKKLMAALEKLQNSDAPGAPGM